MSTPLTKIGTNRSWMRRASPEHAGSKGVMKMIVECKPQGHIKPSGKTAERHDA